MTNFNLSLVVAVLLATGLTACLPSEPEDDQGIEPLYVGETMGELVDEFTQMANNPQQFDANPRRFAITEQLANMGPNALSPLIALMGDPDVSGETRLFALQSLVDLLGPGYIADIEPLLAAEDPVTRACGVSLLSHIMDPQISPLLKAHKDDPDGRVQFSAISGLAMQGDPEARNDLIKRYHQEGTHDFHKKEIVRVILRSPQAEDLSVLEAVIREENELIADDRTRFIIAATLGRIGDSSAIDALKASTDLSEDPDYAEMVKSAIAAIEEREKIASTGV